MAMLASSPVSFTESLHGLPLKPSLKHAKGPLNLSFCATSRGKSAISLNKRKLSVQAEYRHEGSNSAGIFIGGFVLGGVIVGALGCVFAPQISKVLTGTERKELLRKLPKFIYDEEKALEKTRKVLEQKIAQLNVAIDEASAKIRGEDGRNGAAVSPDEIEASF
ncbi:hypothetical protein HPP92_012439 [Vanilla planifolia]|uniref:Uncharacterized protein n=1 Tax=Vanilla planifolia TaxID=51239 RepID=A0A835QWZ1_VANPL|nr:hypothetical protein HPP92_012828 [Vanilla planifolia]KAG0477720.1 hypothetical protein HPP92_012439 [Vanilla planifolia]